MEFLRDPIWQSLSVAVAVAALLLTILLFRMQRNQKKISYEVIASEAAVSVGDEANCRDPQRCEHHLCLENTLFIEKTPTLSDSHVRCSS